ncbi:nucleotidyltransferase [Rhodobacteraceae bacterium WD3A24]|nr:nucleotidyltransferase [Rhodobacteraceae bacterium WD3A24]
MPDRPDAVMIFAAGLGRRMGALTAERPKPLIEVAGRALLDHALDIAADAGLRRRVVNTHYRAEQIAAHLAGRPVAISHETVLLDTGGGLRAARPLLGDGAVATLNSDAAWHGPNPLETLLAGWDGAAMEALLLLVPADRAENHAEGDFGLGADGRLRRGGGLVYTGAQILRTDSLAAIDAAQFSLNRVWDDMACRGTLFGAIHPGAWCDVGTPEGIAAAEAMLSRADV